MFNDYDACLTKNLDISHLNDSTDIEKILQNHCAKFHTTCRLLYSKNRLQREIKIKHPEEDSDSEEILNTAVNRNPRQKDQHIGLSVL